LLKLPFAIARVAPDCAPAPKSGLPDFGTIDAEIGNSRFRLAGANPGYGRPA
jgi:hypothetical protein